MGVSKFGEKKKKSLLHSVHRVSVPHVTLCWIFFDVKKKRAKMIFIKLKLPA